MLIKREQKMREEYAKENDKLMKENSEISSKLSRVETLVERQERDADKQNKAQLAEVTNFKINVLIRFCLVAWK